MLARKIYEHWYLWIIVNFVSVVLFVSRGLYPTVVLYWYMELCHLPDLLNGRRQSGLIYKEVKNERRIS